LPEARCHFPSFAAALFGRCAPIVLKKSEHHAHGPNFITILLVGPHGSILNTLHRRCGFEYYRRYQPTDFFNTIRPLSPFSRPMHDPESGRPFMTTKRSDERLKLGLCCRSRRARRTAAIGRSVRWYILESRHRTCKAGPNITQFRSSWRAFCHHSERPVPQPASW